MYHNVVCIVYFALSSSCCMKTNICVVYCAFCSIVFVLYHYIVYFVLYSSFILTITMYNNVVCIVYYLLRGISEVACIV